MTKLDDLDHEKWLHSVFPEWGTYLSEDIDETEVPAGKLAMWWLTNCGVWLKTPDSANITIDFWAQSGERTKRQRPYDTIKDAQLIRMTGARQYPPFLRCSPHVIDPYTVRQMDAVLSTHIHNDHICEYVAAAAVKNTTAVFVGPKMCGDIWEEWGVPSDRIVRMAPGESLTIKDTVITAVESFDRTALITPPPSGDIRGKMPPSMDDRALNYVIKTPGGTVYHSGDSHFSNRFYKHGQDYDIDIAFLAWGDNGPGITDKLTTSDTLRAARDLNARLLIPIHWDMWATQQVDPSELLLLYHHNKYRLKFKVIIWKVGGRLLFPDDEDVEQYVYPKDHGDVFADEPNIPFPSFL